MVPVSPSRRRCFAPPVIRVDDALCGAARCRGIALWQRSIGAFKVIVVPALVDLQADRIGRVISLGPSRRRRQNRRNHQNRESRNAHPSLLQNMRHMRPTPDDKRPPCSVPSQFMFPRWGVLLTLAVNAAISFTQGADDMSDHDEWISYSHWGMFLRERNIRNNPLREIR